MTTTSQISFDSGALTSGQRRIALTAIGGYFVDGYDLLILGGALLAIRPEFDLTPGQVGLLTAAAFIGMAVGSPISGPLTDRFGRKPIFFTSMLLFVVGSLLTIAVPSLAPLILLRFVVGLAIGADMPPSAALVAEFIPRQRRGTFTGMGGVAWMLGGVLAIVVTLAIYLIAGNEDHWRWVLATGAIPALILLFLRHKTPESPYWLEARGRHEDAMAAWKYARGTEASSAPTHRPVSTYAPARLSVLFRRPFIWLLLCMAVYWGFNNLYGSAILLYQPTLITRIVSPQAYTALLFTGASTLVAAAVGTAVCLWLIESVGRRIVALSCLGMLILACLSMYWGIAVVPLVLIAFGVAIAVINGGTSIAFYAWAPELFPASIRGRAIGIVNMIGKLGSVLGTLALPTLYDAIGHGIFTVIAVAALINFAVVFVLAPETKGRSLDDLARGATRFSSST
ncbi:hypothetical protein BH708_01960 [Brachybacterium sp. P6-10-X1]|uniref:MFS transporter n=1 Tax=Brachybacterium sp. P6-10-X1 TaxID=1903186 RepID=UPI000971B0DF|nr:MFS transporter [Brachybacterium sp. P6-10-X1]APX31691.1 hypothetical protein BH708_01960 [Brachybacterium sp. P6-10-X1]